MDLVERRCEEGLRHPWEQARSRSVMRILRRHGVHAQPVSVLDVGAGDAWLGSEVLSGLAGGSSLTCWDIHYSAKDLAQISEPGRGLYATAARPEGRFGGILMLDVIEHVEDDRGMLTHTVQHLLADGGWALVTVPAHQALFSSHDTALRHFRRYSPSQCRRLLESTGLRVVSDGSLFFSLLAPRAAQVLRERLARPAPSGSKLDEWEHGTRLTRAVMGLLDLDARLSLGLGARWGVRPPGLSYWAFCRVAQRTNAARPGTLVAAATPVQP